MIKSLKKTEDVMLYENGRDRPSYRCECGCNVFRQVLGVPYGRVTYKCNSCGNLVEGIKK